MALLPAQNQRWSLDFVSEALTDGHKFRMLAVVDNFFRKCIIHYPGRRPLAIWSERDPGNDMAIVNRGIALMIGNCNGIEFNSMAILRRPLQTGTNLRYIAGRPHVENSNGRLRDF